MFEYTCEAARISKSEAGLEKTLGHNYIDTKKIVHRYYLTPAAQLAIEGEDVKVEWMRKLGANVNNIAYGYALVGNHKKVDEYRNKYGADVSYIAEGYARAGNHKKVEEYRSKYGANVNMIAKGYAMAGSQDKVDEYRHKHGADVNEIVAGYALGGWVDLVEHYHNLNNDVDATTIATAYAFTGRDDLVEKYLREHKADVNAIAQSYAMAENHTKVGEYHNKFGTQVVASIAKGYAMAGNHSEVRDYQYFYNADVKAIIEGYALAGNHKRVEIWIKKIEEKKITKIGEKEITIDERAKFYAIAGNHEKVIECYINGAKPLEIAEGYKMVGNDNMRKRYDINFLLDNYLEKRKAVVEKTTDPTTLKTTQYYKSKLFSIFQKSNTQKEEAVRDLKNALKGRNVDLSKHLSTLRDGTLGKELRAFIKSGMANALVGGNKVTTVSEFVKVLQERNNPYASRYIRPTQS